MNQETVIRTRIIGCFEYEVVLTDDEREDLPETWTDRELAKVKATKRFNETVEPKFTVDSHDTIAEKKQNHGCRAAHVYRVMIRFDKNDH